MKNLFLIALLIYGISAQAQWTQIGQDIDGEAAGDSFGLNISLSADGSIVAIGSMNNDGNGTSSGHVRIYENNGGTWTQIGQDINGESAGDESAFVSLSSDGSVVAIGARGNDGNGSNSGHVRVYENIVLGISNPITHEITIYPNPVSDLLNIRAEETINTVSIVNILGQEIYKSNVGLLNTTIDLSGFANGTYFAKVQVGDDTITKKFVKE
jgi:hypothetical protein